MDVQAAATAAPTPIPAQPVLPPAPVADAGDPAPAAPAVSGAVAAPAAASTPGPSSGGAHNPGTNGKASNQPTDDTLSPVVAKLFNAAADNVEVSFQVLHNPDEVVTVFTDRATGKEIVQFPSQALVALAEMYDKDAGNVLDKSV
jgi:uncharacterized FlaG/YvyC family protein